MTEYRGIVIEGIEDIAAQEVKGKVIDKGRISFTKEQKEYKTIETVYELDHEFTFETEEDILNQVNKKELKITAPFRVTCRRIGNHLFKAPDLERDVGEVIHEKGFAVSLKEPKTTVFLDVEENKCVIGYLIKQKIEQREYRVRRNHAAISASLAAALIKIAKIQQNESMSDPYCKDGVIAIEAALLGIKQIYATDIVENNIKNAIVNAKMAKVNVTWESKEDPDYVITNYWVGLDAERSKYHLVQWIKNSKAKKKIILLTNWKGLEKAIDTWNIDEIRMILAGNRKQYLFCLSRKTSS